MECRKTVEIEIYRTKTFEDLEVQQKKKLKSQKKQQKRQQKKVKKNRINEKQKKIMERIKSTKKKKKIGRKGEPCGIINKTIGTTVDRYRQGRH